MLRAILFGLCLFAVSSVRADIIFYRVPGIERVVLLQGSATVNAGGSVTYQHPQMGTLYFDLQDTVINRVPTQATIFQRKLRSAEGNADKLMEAAHWALRNGLLPSFYSAVEKALAVNPQQPGAAHIRDLRQAMAAPISDSSQQEKELRDLVQRPEMQVKTSAHYILMYDTSDKPPEGRKLSRADERLKLLELVYESFLLRFYSHGIELDIPKERLKVVLFAEHNDYLQFVSRLSPDLQSAAGFWDGATNTAVFYDQGTTEDFKLLLEVSGRLQQMKNDAKKLNRNERPLFKLGDRIIELKDLARMADTLKLLVDIDRENLDIEVVSHEATHQMAGNTGLLPRHVMVPTWVHEGLATYFETPNDAAWSGIGAVNEERLMLYRILESDREHSNIEFITTDKIFDRAASLDATLHGYGQAWALTHFLMERHFDQFIAYYRRLGEMPPDVIMNPDVLTALFNETFGQNHAGLDGEWRAYMRSLKTDIELALEDK